MKVDVTSMFFNSSIEGKTVTAAWGTSIGQNASKSCRIETGKEGVVDFVVGNVHLPENISFCHFLEILVRVLSP